MDLTNGFPHVAANDEEPTPILDAAWAMFLRTQTQFGSSVEHVAQLRAAWLAGVLVIVQGLHAAAQAKTHKQSQEEASAFMRQIIHEIKTF